MPNPVTMKAIGTQLAVLSKQATLKQRVTLGKGVTIHLVEVTGVTADPIEVGNGDWTVIHEYFDPNESKWKTGEGRLKNDQHAQFEDGLDGDFDDLEVIFVDRLTDLRPEHPARRGQ